MGRPSKYDWEEYRNKFVTGDCQLIDLSMERTGKSSDPPYQTLRVHSCKKTKFGTWDDQRRVFRANLQRQGLEQPPVQEVLKQAEQAAQEARAAIDHLYDVTAIITSHLKLAESLKHAYANLALKMRTAAENIDLSKLSEMDVPQIAKVYRDLSLILQTATDMERKALNLPEPEKTGGTTETRYVISLDTDSRVGQTETLEESIAQWSQEFAQN